MCAFSLTSLQAGVCALREIVLINITGEDRPGLTAAITGVLAQGGVNCLLYTSDAADE